MTVWGFIFTCFSVPTSLFGIYELLKKGVIRWKRHKVKSIIWDNSSDWVIVTPQYDEKYRRVEDIIASEKLYEHCNKLGLHCCIQDDSQAIPPDKNLILICGPKANKATRKLYRHFHINIELTTAPVTIKDDLSGCSYKAEYDPTTHDVTKDYAILSRYIDSDTGRIYVFCMGIHGIGTMGAACVLLDYKLIKYIKSFESFEAVVSVPVINNRFSIGPADFIIPPRKLK